MSAAPTAPLRVLEIEIFGRGGLTHYTYNLSVALARRGHSVAFVTAAGYELEGRSDRPESLDVIQAIGRFDHRWGERLPSPLRALTRKVEAILDAFNVALLAHRLRPDVIHLQCTNPIALLHLFLLAKLGSNLVTTAHNVTPHEPIPFQSAVYRRIHGLGDLVIAHSKIDRERLRREFSIAPERVAVIPHGEYGFFDRDGEATDRAAARRSLDLGPRDEVALFFGYIREYKGLDILFEAWPEVVRNRPAARLVVAGEPVRLGNRRRRELEDWASRLGAVHRFGYVPFSEVSRYFASADALVMPYRHLSQSGVLYLALSLGVPVVATRVGALPEMLRDGESAVLVPPESPSDLADALARLLGDAGLRSRLARGGRLIAERHSWPAVAERTENAMLGLLDDR